MAKACVSLPNAGRTMWTSRESVGTSVKWRGHVCLNGAMAYSQLKMIVAVHEHGPNVARSLDFSREDGYQGIR